MKLFPSLLFSSPRSILFHRSLRFFSISNYLVVFVWILSLCGCTVSWQDKLENGKRHMDRGEFTDAVYLFSDVADCGHPEGWLYRGDAYAALAEITDKSSELKAVYYVNALTDYQAAREFLGDTEVLSKLTALYFSMGDNALSLEDYDGADGYYNSILNENHANADAYGRLADVSIARGRTEEAAIWLKKGVAATHNEKLSARLKDLQIMFDEKERQTQRLAASQALRDVPYFGDTEQCTMGPEQELSYAQLIADGLTGKFHGFSGYGRPLYNGNVYWDEPYAVLGLGTYETDRARVLLGDFSGDGNPYLYLFSSVVDEKSFEVYGWKDGEVQLAVGVEAFGSQREGRLAVTEQGTVVLEESEPTGDRSRSGRTVRFIGGGTGVAGLLDESWDPTEEAVRVTENGVPGTYTEEAWEHRERLSTAALDAVAVRAFSLRDMLDALNRYAEALGSASDKAVPAPPEHSSRHRMATAMLRKLFALNRMSIEETGTRLCDTRLLDLDQDGQEELFVAFQGEYQSDSGTACQFALYHWLESNLEEYPGSTGLDELHLARYENEYGILGAGRDPDLPLNQSLTEQDTSDPLAEQSVTLIEEQEWSQGEMDANYGEQEIVQGENSSDVSKINQDILSENSHSNTQSRESYTLRYSYTFLSHSEALVMDAIGERRSYRVVRSGKKADIAESEFSVIRGRYTVLQTLINYRITDSQNRNYASVISTLFRMQSEN